MDADDQQPTPEKPAGDAPDAVEPPEAAVEAVPESDAERAGESPGDDEAPAYSESETELLARLERELGAGIVEHADTFGTLVVRVRPDSWRRAGEVAKRHLECDFLSFISGLDWQPAPREGDEESGDTSAPVQPTEMTFGAAGSAGRFQVFAHVESTECHWGVTLKTDVEEGAPRVESWVDIYPGADWHERECWEMYGFGFEGHPSLRHLYLPGEFEGHPLRKDFPLLARVVKPWPGLVDVEAMPEEPEPTEASETDEAAEESAEESKT